MSTVAEIGSGGLRDLDGEALAPSPEREPAPVMRNDERRRVLDRVDEFSFDLTQLESAVRALRVALAEIRVRVRDNEHDIDQLKARRK